MQAVHVTTIPRQQSPFPFGAIFSSSVLSVCTESAQPNLQPRCSPVPTIGLNAHVMNQPKLLIFFIGFRETPNGSRNACSWRRLVLSLRHAWRFIFTFNYVTARSLPVPRGIRNKRKRVRADFSPFNSELHLACHRPPLLLPDFCCAHAMHLRYCSG
jgi:hypothetical protein